MQLEFDKEGRSPRDSQSLPGGYGNRSRMKVSPEYPYKNAQAMAKGEAKLRWLNRHTQRHHQRPNREDDPEYILRLIG